MWKPYLVGNVARARDLFLHASGLPSQNCDTGKAVSCLMFNYVLCNQRFTSSCASEVLQTIEECLLRKFAHRLCAACVLLSRPLAGDCLRAIVSKGNNSTISDIHLVAPVLTADTCSETDHCHVKRGSRISCQHSVQELHCCC